MRSRTPALVYGRKRNNGQLQWARRRRNNYIRPTDGGAVLDNIKRKKRCLSGVGTMQHNANSGEAAVYFYKIWIVALEAGCRLTATQATGARRLLLLLLLA